MYHRCSCFCFVTKSFLLKASDFLSNLMTLCFGFVSYFGVTNSNIDVFSKILTVVCCIIGIYALSLYRKKEKYKRYYNSFPKLNEAFDIIHSITNPDIDDNDYNDDLILLRKFCVLIKEVFETLGNGKVRVCIKILVIDNEKNKYYLQPLVRDEPEEMKNDIDKLKARKFTWLSENTCFTDIFIEEKMEIQNDFYFNNNIPSTKNYINTRIVELKRENKYPPKFLIKWLSIDSHLIGNYLSILFWKFYKSTIVTPVFPLKTEEYGTKSIGSSKFDDKRESNLHLEGFLCIDSMKYKRFNKRDVDILRGLSAGIYNALRSIREKEQLKQ